ncbi:Crp/Fnr family transcriptional regulator [Hyphococcus sp.]|uniref:Crp/Fnr family transcriptional regulator n=1 Tax=Hyphococcus sp. TaxID=2038636 RepID=UPI003D1104A6
MAKGAEVLSWIDPLPDDLRQAVMSEMKSVRIKQGALIYERFSQAKGLWHITSGTVRLFSLAPDGRELIFKIYGSSECFGELAAIDGEPYSLSAEAMTDCELMFLSRNRLIELRKKHPALETALLDLVVRIARTSVMTIEVATIFPLHARVAARLAFLAASAKARREPVTELKIAQKDLGVMVGASRQAVNKVLAEFQAMGLVETHYGSLRITDIDGLKRQTLRFSSQRSS